MLIEGAGRIRNSVRTYFSRIIGAIVMSATITAAATAQEVRVRDLYPLITTPALFEARDFYTRHFGFQTVFEASWFVYLIGPGEDDTRGATLAFMSPDHPSNPPGPETFDGKGMILTIEVADVAAFYEKLQAEGAPIVYPLTDEDWGQKRFMVRDPSGTLVDVLEQTAPKDGYWDQYLAPQSE